VLPDDGIIRSPSAKGLNMVMGKVWGSTEELLSTPMLSLHRLKIFHNHHCSLHVHRFKWNGFYVIRGKLFIEVIKNDYALTDVTELAPGDITTVKPGEHHRFRTGDENCEALEFYYTEPLSEDIIRKDKGGPVEA
jgi:mannose-6-phosphate isomerase-like protein (cupin superfamily)